MIMSVVGHDHLYPEKRAVLKRWVPESIAERTLL